MFTLTFRVDHNKQQNTSGTGPVSTSNAATDTPPKGDNKTVGEQPEPKKLRFDLWLCVWESCRLLQINIIVLCCIELLWLTIGIYVMQYKSLS